MYPIHFSLKNLITTLTAAALIFGLWLMGMPCLFQYFFHLPCPGCGMTRAVVSALRGDWRLAWEYHPGIVLLPLFYLYFWQDGRVFHSKALNTGVLAAAALLFFLRYIVIMVQFFN